MVGILITNAAAILITSALAIFILGAALCVIALVSLAIRREERTFFRTGRVSISWRTADPATLAGRGVTGLWVRYWDGERPLPADERAAVHHRESEVLPEPEDTIPHWPSASQAGR